MADLEAWEWSVAVCEVGVWRMVSVGQSAMMGGWDRVGGENAGCGG